MASRGTLCPASPSVLCVVCCPGVVCVVRGVACTEDIATNIFLDWGGAPKSVPGWCGCLVGVAVLLRWAGAGGQGSTAIVEQILAVVDVPVTFSDEFQQSKSYMFLKEPQIQFIDRAGPPCCATETLTHSANCPEDGRNPTDAVLGQG